MPSLKSHLLAFAIKHWLRPAFTSPEGLHDWIRWARPRQDHRPPPKLARRLDIRRHETAGFPVYEVRPKRIASRQRLLYLHGGAYIFEISRFHWNLIGELAERRGAAVTVPVYPLAPEYRLDAMLGMTMQVYADMLKESPASDIVFVGDSAGGSMAMVMTMLAAEQGLPLPAAQVLISPALDLSLANQDVHAFAKRDPWLAIPGGLEAVRLFAPDLDRSDWRLSPIYGDLSVLPRTLLLTGTRDTLHPDALVFAAKARQAGVEVELYVAPGMIHVWLLFGIREARPARDRIVAFLAEVERKTVADCPSIAGEEQGPASWPAAAS
jgi:acetyl esterase/lipase